MPTTSEPDTGASPSFGLRLSVLVAFVTVALVAPVLGGAPVYDDVLMVRNPAMSTVGELWHVFERSSVDYFRAGGVRSDASQGATYRPVTMATLIATAGFGQGLLAHHIVSALLHALTALALGYALRRAGRPDWLALTLAVAFALHPAVAEAWVWVNGRSDLVAGLFLAALLWLVARPGGATWALLVAAVVACGSLSKETFLFAACGVIAAAAVRSASRDRVRLGLGGVAGVLFAVAARYMVVGEAGRPTSDVAHWLARTPRLLAMACESLVAPAARPMRLLAFELTQAPTTLSLVALGAFLAFFLLAVRARRFEGPILLACAAACVVPTAHVADIFWLGFDRYLYMPLLLTVVALAPWVEQLSRGRERLVKLAFVAFGIIAGVATMEVATFYVSDRALGTAMTLERPSDPTGPLYLASELHQRGDAPAAVRALEVAPTSDIAAVEHRRALLWIELGRRDRAREVILTAHAASPHDPFLAADAFGLAVVEGRTPDMLELARVARTREGARRVACDALAANADHTEALRDVRATLACAQRP